MMTSSSFGAAPCGTISMSSLLSISVVWVTIEDDLELLKLKVVVVVGGKT